MRECVANWLWYHSNEHYGWTLGNTRLADDMKEVTLMSNNKPVKFEPNDFYHCHRYLKKNCCLELFAQSGYICSVFNIIDAYFQSNYLCDVYEISEARHMTILAREYIDFIQQGLFPGRHCWNYYPGALSFLSSHCDPFVSMYTKIAYTATKASIFTKKTLSCWYKNPRYKPDDLLRFIMGIPIPMKRCLLSE